MAKMMKSLLGGISRMSGSDNLESETDKQSHVREDSPLESKLSESDHDDMQGGSVEDLYDFEAPNMKGTLSKWTNYLHGWQERYFVLEEGVLSYFKSEFDTQFGCRGSVNLQKTKVSLHEFDPLRFDIRGHGCTYFLRAASGQEKQEWADAIEGNKKYIQENGISPNNTIRRQGSVLSLSAMSQASATSFKLQMNHDLHSKLSELETYREILCRQVDLLQAYFETCADSETGGRQSSPEMTNGISNSAESIDDIPEEDTPPKSNLSSPSSPVTRKLSDVRPPSSSHSPLPSRFTPKGHRRTGSDPFSFRPSTLQVPRNKTRPFSVGGGSPPDVSGIDIRGEAVTFKATTAGLISTLSHCIELMSRREESWHKKFEKEQERRQKAEAAAQAAMNGPRVEAYKYAGPDFEEGPHSALNEEEFFDALEMAYQNDEIEPTVGVPTTQKPPPAATAQVSNGPVQAVKHPVPEEVTPELDVTEPQCNGIPDEMQIKSLSGVKHRLTPLVNDKTSKYAQYIFEPVDSDVWSVVHEEGDMTVHRRELEEDGVVVDPLKAMYNAQGISAKEVINFFFDKETRLEWEGTLESVELIETLAEDTMVFHQLHKRVWPSTQRETLFCSHLCNLTNAPRPENMIGHTWMVCNFSLDHDKVPPSSKLIRATINAGLVCQTIANKKVQPGKESELSRGDIQCRLYYAVNVNPGGWAPPSVVRAIGKREVCKFLKKFSETVYKRLSSTPLSL